MGNVLGVDIGACYAKAAFVPDGGAAGERVVLRPVLHDSRGAMFRVCGGRDAQGRLRVITSDARRIDALEGGEHLVENVKPLRGEPGAEEELEVLVLREILDGYRAASLDQDLAQLERVVLAHPVSAGPAHVEALKRIAVAAGVPAERIDTIEEPVALGLYATRDDHGRASRLLVIDAGHYTTDLVHLEIDPLRGEARAMRHLPLRLGVAELCHALATALWRKTQLVAGHSQASAAPFDAEGPESQDRLVRRLCGLVEARIIRALEYAEFSEEQSAQFDPRSWAGGSVGDWLADMDEWILFFYDDSAAAVEDLASYPRLDPRHASSLRRLNYRESIRPLLDALCAAVFSSMMELDVRAGCRVIIGGGMALIPQVHHSISSLLTAHGLTSALDLSYAYPGLGHLPMGSLLGVAAGAAIAGTCRFLRQDTLADTLGIGRVWLPSEQALELLAADVVLPEEAAALPGWTQEHGARQIQRDDGTYEEWLPLYRVLLGRGAPLPAAPGLVHELFPFGARGTLSLVVFHDSARTSAGTEGDVTAIGEIAVPDYEDGLRLVLEIERNDSWRIVLMDTTGRIIADRTGDLTTLGRAGRR